MSQDMQVISISNKLYPPLLREIHDPPAQLYVRGNVDILSSDKLLAVVGSRNNSYYGQKCVTDLLTPVVKAGIPLVSGLAFGIDSLAHKLCVDLNQPTIAVLGSGADDATIYPHQHVELAHQIIAQNGAVISEYKPRAPSRPGRFPARNRIIAGLTKTTLVVQAAQKSGSLVTARLALESDRDVAAVPGAITDPLAQGTNHLIQQGATPILKPQDLLDIFELAAGDVAAQIIADLSPQQQQVAQHLSAEPQHIDVIADRSNLPTSLLSVTLIELEMHNVVQNVGGQRYVKI